MTSEPMESLFSSVTQTMYSELPDNQTVILYLWFSLRLMSYLCLKNVLSQALQARMLNTIIFELTLLVVRAVFLQVGM